jgi:hypothetical protein
MASRFECPRCQTVFVKDIEGDAAFVECPSCGALALPASDAHEGALSRAVSGSHPGPVAGVPDASAAAPFGAGLPGSMSTPSFGPGFGSTTTSPPAPVLDFDLGDEAAPRPAAPARATTPASASPTSLDWLGDGDAAAPVHMLPPDALAALAAAAADEGATVENPGPWSSLSEEAFGDLDKAFDEMALRPPPRRELSRDEARFLMGDGAEVSSSGVRPPPMRPPPRPRTSAPPRKAKPAARTRPTHFTLSDAARTLAFLPLRQVEPVESRPARDRRPSSSDHTAVHSERSVALRASPEGAGRPGAGAQTGQLERPHGQSWEEERTDRLRARSGPERRVVPSVWRGLSLGRVAALACACLILGGAAGAYSAPKQSRGASPRARAELQLAAGNRFYDQGRFDDALGAYKAALVDDDVYAAAWRAKGAALAKLGRYDDAADAYRRYLALEPRAPDARDVKEAVARRGPSAPSSTP